MLDNENQVKAYKALQLHPVTLPHAHTKSTEIIAQAESKETQWQAMLVTTVAYPASMDAAISDIKAITAAISESAAAAGRMISALSGAETPSEFITLGIGWDVVQKTAASPPATFPINTCIADKDKVGAVSSSLSKIDGATVARVMGEINVILTPAPSGAEGGSTGGAAAATVPPEKIKELTDAIAPCKAESLLLSAANANLSKIAADGAESKETAVKAFNDAVTIAVINATTSGTGVMNDVMAAVVSEEVINALRG